MGMFGTKKKTHVDTQTHRLTEDADIMQIMKEVMLAYILEKHPAKQLVPDVLAGYQASLPYKLNRAYHYAKSGRYHYGEVTSSYVYYNDDVAKQRVEEQLSLQYGQPVHINYMYHGDANNHHVMWYRLYNEFGYQRETNQLNFFSEMMGTDCYLHDVHIRYCSYSLNEVESPELYEAIGLAFTHGRTLTRRPYSARKQTEAIEDINIPYDMADILFSFRSSEDYSADPRFVSATLAEDIHSEYIEDVENAPPPQPLWDYIFKYEVDFLSYEMSGSPDLYEHEDEEGNIVSGITPVNNVYLSIEYMVGTDYYYILDPVDGQNDELYKISTETKTPFEFYPRIYARLNNQRLNTDNHKDTEAYKSSKAICNRLGMVYSDFVDNLHKDDVSKCPEIFLNCAVPAIDTHPIAVEYLFNFFDTLYEVATPTNTNFRAGFTTNIRDKVYSQTFGFSSISKHIVQGYIKNDYEYADPNVEGPYLEDLAVSSLVRRLLRKNVFRYRRKIDDTQFEEIFVKDLYVIQYAKGHAVRVSGQNANLLIPVDRRFVKKLSFNKKEFFLAHAMNFVINIHYITKRKWYQRGIFRVIMLIVAVILQFIPGGQPFGWALFAIALLKAIVISIIIELAIRLMIKLGIGVKFAMVLAVIAIIVAGATGALGNAGSAFSASANNMIKVANVAYKLVSGIQQHEFKTMAKTLADLRGQYDEKYKELQKTRALLGDAYLPLDFINMAERGYSNMEFITLGETPDIYYAKTLEQNVGQWVYDIQDNYHESQLTPPTLQQILTQRQQQLEKLNEGIEL